MKTEKFQFSNIGFDPRIWIKSLRRFIPYVGNGNQRESVFQKIRDAYASVKPIPVNSGNVIPGIEAIPPENKEEDNLVTVDIEQLVDKYRANNTAIKTVKGPEYYGENVTKPEFTFMQNLEAVRLEFSGIGKGPGKLYEDKNVTNPKNNFLQNLDAISLEFSGKGTGPVEIQTENSYDPKKSLIENLMQAKLDEEGNGETVEMINKNVTDPNKSFMENIEAVSEAFSNASSGTGKIKIEKRNVSRR